jgi:hypothetical protein
MHFSIRLQTAASLPILHMHYQCIVNQYQSVFDWDDGKQQEATHPSD